MWLLLAFLSAALLGFYDEKNPFVMLEVDSLLLARTAQHEKGYYGKHHANPMLVQSWYNVYQVFIMCPISCCCGTPSEKKVPRFVGTGPLSVSPIITISISTYCFNSNTVYDFCLLYYLLIFISFG